MRGAFVERRRHLLDRVARALLGLALDQHGVEDALADKAADLVLQPIVGGGDGPRLLPDRLRQHRPDQHEVAVAGVVGEIDARAEVGEMRAPFRPDRGDGAGEERDEAGDELLDHRLRPPSVEAGAHAVDDGERKQDARARP